MKKLLPRVVLALFSSAVFLVLAEFAYRALMSGGEGLSGGEGGATGSTLHVRWSTHYEGESGKVYHNVADAAPDGLVVPLLGGPRPTWRFAPGETFYICYTGLDPETRGDEFDRRGDQGSLCVRNSMNSLGMREREEVVGAKPEGQRRVLCLGDSFTFGWGVQVEKTWPRLVEKQLRELDDGVRTLNGGAAGTMYVDEYRAALEQRLHVVTPDLVLVTLCLNDLLPTTQALALQVEAPWLLRKSMLARALLSSYAMQAELTPDPGRDYVQEMLDAPADSAWYQSSWLTALRIDKGVLWPGGGPQQALQEMRGWCGERGIGFAVAIWPYFQGLGPGERYPLQKIHDLVGEFCAAEQIPLLDLLPTLKDQAPTQDLWVSPADYHGNARAHALAEPAITAFLAKQLGLR